VRLSIAGFTLTDSTDTILWQGEIGNATFPVQVPSDATPGPHAGQVTFHIEGLQIAKLHFVVEVGPREAAREALPVKEQRLRSAFASYASPDRDEVLARVQGMQKALPSLDVFLDVASLRSGDRWADRLTKEISDRDVFYLFWSAHASKSEWVEREWRTALQVRGIDYIDPVPLAPPAEVPPPPELADQLHFNDWVLAYMRCSKPR
jgi:hypothetical protein